MAAAFQNVTNSASVLGKKQMNARILTDYIRNSCLHICYVVFLFTFTATELCKNCRIFTLVQNIKK